MSQNIGSTPADFSNDMAGIDKKMDSMKDNLGNLSLDMTDINSNMNGMTGTSVNSEDSNKVAE